MAKPETTFTASVHRHLPPLSQLWREKMANPYRGGTADCWYSAAADMWVEWKFLLLPKRDTTVVDLVTKGDIISPLQRSWLRDRSDEGRNVWVIVGCKEGGVPFHSRLWEVPLTTAEFRDRLRTRQQLAELITQEVRA